MSMHDSIHALKVDETVQSAHLLLQRFTGGSSLQWQLRVVRLGCRLSAARRIEWARSVIDDL